MVREEHEGISVDVITTELDIELPEGDTASKGSQSLPHITAVNRGALSCDSREVHKPRLRSSDRTAGHECSYLYLSNGAAATSALCFPMNAALTVYRKTKWTITWDISWPTPLL